MSIFVKQKLDRELITTLHFRAMSVLSKLDFDVPFKLDAKRIGYILLGGAVTLKLLLLLKSDTTPVVYYPIDKQTNFAVITQQSNQTKKLPKVFWATGFYPFDLRKLLVITDFDVLEKTFKNPAVSDRLKTAK